MFGMKVVEAFDDAPVFNHNVQEQANIEGTRVALRGKPIDEDAAPIVREHVA